MWTLTFLTFRIFHTHKNVFKTLKERKKKEKARKVSFNNKLSKELPIFFTLAFDNN